MPEWALNLVCSVFCAGAIYGGIRGDLKRAIECALEAKAIGTRANDRIDNMLIKGN